MSVKWQIEAMKRAGMPDGHAILTSRGSGQWVIYWDAKARGLRELWLKDGERIPVKEWDRMGTADREKWLYYAPHSNCQ